jgi:3-methyladenine DNA glycosylase AlkD
MHPIATLAQQALRAVADPVKAPQMAAYMKTDMPFHGVQKPLREQITSRLVAECPIRTRRDYEDAVQALWRLPHREEKYLAISIARAWPQFIGKASLPMYTRMIREGAWWDFVDEIAIRLVGGAIEKDRPRMLAAMDRWIAARDMWVRRSAIICQLTHKTRTDRRRLFQYCSTCAGESEFFIRKAIGWALREYAKTDADAVRNFVNAHRDVLSPLSIREATKHISM